MKRLLLTLAAAGLFGCYLPAQTITAAVIDKKMSDGSFAEAEVTLEANSLLGFDGSKNPVRVAIGDNLTLSGSPLTLAAAAGGTWGTITGTLSAQTDLQTALNAKLNSSAVSAFGLTLIDDADAAAARTTLGLGTLATQSANIGDYLTSATAASTYAALSGSYANPAWITSLAWSKITGAPAYDAMNHKLTAYLFEASTIPNQFTRVHPEGIVLNPLGPGSLEIRAPLDLSGFTRWELTLPGSAGTNGQVLTTDGTGVTSWTTVGGSGTVTSVAVAGTDGLEVDSGSPITSAGTITLGINASTLKTHLSLGNVENTALSTWAGSTNLTTLGTIASGTWQGSIIAPAYLGTGSDIATKYLRGDGTWQTVAGSGIGGSTGSTDNAILRADGTGGSTLQSSLVTIDDDGNITMTGNIQAGQLLLKVPAAANAVTIKSDAFTDAWTLFLPTTAGSEGTVLLNTGGGMTTWGNVEWDDIDKAGSSLADLATRSADDLTSGTLALERGGTGATTASGARTALELGDSATRNVGTTTGTVAAGDDARFVNAAAVEIGLACSDETSDLTTGTAKVTFRMPHAMTLTAVRASVTTAGTGSTIIVDINEAGASVLGTKLSIDASERTSTTAASAATITDSALADDAEITIDLDQIGSSTPGTGLKVWLIGTRN